MVYLFSFAIQGLWIPPPSSKPHKVCKVNTFSAVVIKSKFDHLLKKEKEKKKDFGVERFDFNEKIQLKIIEPHALLPVKARYLFSTLARGRTIRPFLAICSHFYVLSAPSGTVCLFCSPIEWGHFGLLHLILQGNDRRNSF